jgi:photosystem II stability/assembly factor-like uncharacterized protein
MKRIIILASVLILFHISCFNGSMSFDDQKFWQRTNGPDGGAVLALAINSSGHIYAAIINAGVFRSTDNGENWSSINDELKYWFIDCLAINSSDHIFIGTDFSGIFRSTDHGQSWEQLNSTVADNDYVFALVINSNGHIFAGAWRTGVHRSMDNGNSWVQINTGLVNIHVYSLAFNPNEIIFTGTEGGVYRSIQSTASLDAFVF